MWVFLGRGNNREKKDHKLKISHWIAAGQPLQHNHFFYFYCVNTKKAEAATTMFFRWIPLPEKPKEDELLLFFLVPKS